jgi:hypothetical protein
MLDALKSYLLRVNERRKSLREGRRRTVYTIFHNANAMRLSFVTVENVRGEILLAWEDTLRIEAFKRDLYTVDLICLLIHLRDNRTLEIDEEMDGWKSLVDKLPEYLPGCQNFEQWFSAVAFPAFKPNITKIYQRDTGQNVSTKNVRLILH